MPVVDTDALARAFQAAAGMDAPLSARLDAYAAAVDLHAPDYSMAVDRLIARLRAVSAGDGSPKVGDTMPDFLLPDEQGRLVALADLLREGPAVIAFHRGHWCPFCRINARGLAQIEDAVRVRRGKIVAITPERGQYAVQHRKDASARYVMLSDIEGGYALSLDLAVWMDDDIRTHLLGFGRDLEVYLGSRGWILPIPATFVVRADGRVAARFVDPDYRRRMDLKEILSAIEHAI